MDLVWHLAYKGPLDFDRAHTLAAGLRNRSTRIYDVRVRKYKGQRGKYYVEALIEAPHD